MLILLMLMLPEQYFYRMMLRESAILFDLKHQVRYSTIEKETLALLLTLLQFEVYVGSTLLSVQIYTDLHSSSCVSIAHVQQEPTTRWAQFCQITILK